MQVVMSDGIVRGAHFLEVREFSISGRGVGRCLDGNHRQELGERLVSDPSRRAYRQDFCVYFVHDLVFDLLKHRENGGVGGEGGNLAR